MKKIISIVFTFLLLASISYSTPDAKEITLSFTWKNVPVSQALEVYKNLTKADLIISSNLGFHTITLNTEKPISKEDAEQLIEKTLLKQAGIVITPLDANHISVTYNDQLKLEQ